MGKFIRLPRIHLPGEAFLALFQSIPVSRSGDRGRLRNGHLIIWPNSGTIPLTFGESAFPILVRSDVAPRFFGVAPMALIVETSLFGAFRWSGWTPVLR